MKYFNFPKEWEVNKFIPKEAIYLNIDADEKMKKLFVDSIERVKLKYILNYENTNIDTYIEGNERYEEINFISIELRRFGNEDKIAKVFHSFIPKATVLVFQYEDKILLSTAVKSANKSIKVEKVYNTSWFMIKEQENFIKSLDMRDYNTINLKEFYGSILDRIKAFKVSEILDDFTLVNIDENINKVDKILECQNEIESLKKKLNHEKHTFKRAEIVKEIKKLNEALKELS